MQILKQCRTPWDVEGLTCPYGDAMYFPFDKVVLSDSPVTWPQCKERIYLHGRWLVDPARATSEDARQFMWAGLRVLRAEAKARGLSEEQVDRLLTRAFDTFHDVAESIWSALKAVQTLSGHHGLSCGDFWPPAASFRPRVADLAPASGCGHTSIPAADSTEEQEDQVPAAVCEDASTRADLFIACEEDRPVPVKIQFNKPLTLLDPDLEILASFEP
jgi:hypothetical protein